MAVEDFVHYLPLAIDYVLDLPCAVKHALPTEQLAARIKDGGGAGIFDMLRYQGDQRPASEIIITRRRQTPQGEQDQTVTLQQMIDADDDLEPLEPHCLGCSANLRTAAFGCFGSINYPITAATEAWLMALLPAQLTSTAGELLMRAIKDFGYDGAPVAAMRRREDLFEAKKPVNRRWGSLLSKTTITSDQILQAMFCVGALQPSHCRMLALFLGLLPHDLDPQALRDTAALNARLAEATIEPPDNAQAELGFFLRALALSSVLDATVLVDC
jgi:hypothetical protein